MCFLNYLFSQLNKHGVSLLHSILLQLTSAWHQTKSSCRLLWRQLPWRQDTLGTVVMDTGWVDVSLCRASLLRQEIAQLTFAKVLYLQADGPHVIIQRHMQNRLWASFGISDVFLALSCHTVAPDFVSGIKDDELKEWWNCERQRKV